MPADIAALGVVRAVGLLACVAFFAIRFPSWSGFLTIGAGASGGDLFQMVRVERFEEPMPPESTTPPRFGVPPDSAEIVLIGDSHSRFARGAPSLAALLHRRLPGFRSVAVTAIHPRFFDPVDLLKLERIPHGTVQMVVLESAERAFPDVALGKLPQPFHSWDTTLLFDAVQTARELRSRWFQSSEAGYQYLLLNSWATRELVQFWNTARFQLSGSLPASIGAWNDSGHLFLAEEMAALPPAPGATPTSFLQQRDQQLVTTMADRIAEARDRLRLEYGAELVVLGVPAKSSLLHLQLGKAYDSFLPRLHRELQRRGIRSIDSWSALAPLGEDAVLRTESHLSARSYEVLADSLVLAIQSERDHRTVSTPN